MSRLEPIGIKRLEAIVYYVHDLERSHAFYVDKLDFAVVGRSGGDLTGRGKQRSVVYQAGDCRVVCIQPQGEGGRAWRWLQRHPDGVGTLVFEVEDIDRCLQLVEERGGTPITDVETLEDEHGVFRTFSITTPFGSSTFRFVQRDGYRGLYPGFDRVEGEGGHNGFGFGHFDHITSNFETMKPALLWMEHVLGFEEYWDIRFHTHDVSPDADEGSGLKSVVMWDPHSGVKFANNEPWRPFFKRSQINLFAEDQRGDGIQHAAITVGDIIPAVRGLRSAGVSFMPTPGAYYDYMPQRLVDSGIQYIDEDIDVLRELEILVDGQAEHAYLLQIFLQESAGLYADAQAGPFFFEIIQRKGDRGFGGGNFRALFESIERKQREQGRI
ncbi:MAG: VOC family protein [Alphaproteobacteria bacterium]|nr:VOC family protein [Alphaproteobacteria bacterium]